MKTISSSENTRDYFIDTPDENVVQDLCLPISKALMLIRESREDLKSIYTLDTQDNRRAFFFWWLYSGSREYPGIQLTLKQKQNLLKTDARITQDQKIPLPSGLIELWLYRADLKKSFDLINNKSDRQRFLVWWLEHYKEECPFLNPNIEDDVTNIENSKNKSNEKGTFLENGINIVGFARGELGIGEDTRMAALAMKNSNISFSIYNANIVLSCREKALEFNEYISIKPKYETNLICIPAENMFQMVINDDNIPFHNRYNIGAWQWELPLWPEKWNIFFNFIDEIWAFSHYIEDVFKKSTKKPVIYMPMVVEYPSVIKMSRGQFNLPENTFLFLIMFDGNSRIKRKNPLAGVIAFCTAFPKNTYKQVALVIKAMNINDEDPDWKLIMGYSKNDSRIIIINKVFSRQIIMGLLNICDTYVSLHRAEGFGRIMAESMLLNKPVIATNYSGNTDFTSENTAFMVNGEIVPLKEGDYPCWENQYWCDPDINEAAEQMRKCYEDKLSREIIALSGQNYIRQNYSSGAVGARYRERLLKINAIDQQISSN